MDPQTLELIDRALAEDVGPGDATAEATVDPSARARATITQKAPGVISGLGVAEAVFRRLDAGATVARLGPEGEWREAPAPVVRAVRAAGGEAQVLDTRKTTPGMRALEKRAVADGGGVNHRIGLHDFILIKENHAALAGGVGEAVRRARGARPDLGLAVEVRDATEIDEALAAGAPRLLLDNMTPDAVR